MAYTVGKFTITNAAATLVVTGAAGQAVLVRARENPVLLGPSSITADGTLSTDGFRIDPSDGPIELPPTAAGNDLYARGLKDRPAKLETLVKAGS